VWRTLLVGVGGLIGTVGRYWLGGWVQVLSNAEFPFGTLAVNVLGSFVLGVILTLSLERGIGHPDLRLFLAVGVCGGFTTMSTFSYETLVLLQRGLIAAALANAAGTVALCVGAVWMGALAARIL
jgi:CrcB protein